jgi:hypothetical protein
MIDENDLLLKPFSACAVHYEESDALEYRSSDAVCIYEWINPDLEIIRDMNTREIIGARINGFSRWKDEI